MPVALPTSSGASALHVALLACNLGPQDTVLVPALTMVVPLSPFHAAHIYAIHNV